MSSEKFDTTDPDAHTKFSTYGLFLPVARDILPTGIKFMNAPK
jgi:hypothetical protein